MGERRFCEEIVSKCRGGLVKLENRERVLSVEIRTELV